MNNDLVNCLPASTINIHGESMRRLPFSLPLVLSMIMFGCSVSIKVDSVVGKPTSVKPSSFLLVNSIPKLKSQLHDLYEITPRSIDSTLGKISYRLSSKFKEHHISCMTYELESKSQQLTLEDESNLPKIKTFATKAGIDAIIFINFTSLEIHNGALVNLEMEARIMETNSEKIIHKCLINAYAPFSNAHLPEEVANTLVDRLISDKIIN